MCLPLLDSYKCKAKFFPKAVMAVPSEKGHSIGIIRHTAVDGFSGHTVFEYLALWESFKFHILKGRKNKLLSRLTDR